MLLAMFYSRMNLYVMIIRCSVVLTDWNAAETQGWPDIVPPSLDQLVSR